MQEMYAKILASHAADLITRTSSLMPKEPVIKTPPEKINSCDLGVRIDFKGQGEGTVQMSGYVICGFATRAEAMPLLRSLAEYFGFDPQLTQTEQGPMDILSEYLNIIIGLAGADWSEHGFDMRFSPPCKVSARIPDEDYACKKAFHISIHTDSAAKMDIVLVFVI